MRIGSVRQSAGEIAGSWYWHGGVILLSGAIAFESLPAAHQTGRSDVLTILLSGCRLDGPPDMLRPVCRESPAMTLRECYLKLDLRPGAPLDEIKRAYRQLAIAWHPDRFPGDAARRRVATERFKSISAAYSRLRSASERERSALRQEQLPSAYAASRAPARRGGGVQTKGFHGWTATRRRAYETANRDRPRRSSARSAGRRATVSTERTFPPGVEEHRINANHRSGRAGARKAAVRRWFQGWAGVLLVAVAVGIFCLGLLRSTTLAEMLAWTAIWAVVTSGAFVLAPERP